MGCSGFTSERACNEAIGLEKLQPLYEKHWSSFYSQEDFYEMKERGLNTVRIPLPCKPNLSKFAEPPRGILRNGTNFRSIDLPQTGPSSQPLPTMNLLHAGRCTTFVRRSDGLRMLPFESFSIFTDFRADRRSRASQATILEPFPSSRTTTTIAPTKYSGIGQLWLTLILISRLVRYSPLFLARTFVADIVPSTVDVIEPVNEPKQGIQPGLLDVYYPQAQKVIRETEKSLGVTCGGSGKQCLTVQYMANSWGSGDPVPHIDTDDRFALDDHLCEFLVKFAKRNRSLLTLSHADTQWIVAESQRTRQGYLDFLCTTTRTTGQGGPTIAGEWSLSTIGGGELETTSDGATEFFKKFAAAQIYAGEKGA